MINVDEVLQQIHEIELAEKRWIHRKELHKHLPDGLTYEDKRLLIRAWQDSRFVRTRHILSRLFGCGNQFNAG